MAPTFSKNAILVGMIDNFCLVCENYLKSESDTITHIAKPVHQKLLGSLHYVEEFKEDGIKKIKNKHFCELCNKLLTTLPRVRLHVTEQIHKDNKRSSLLKRDHGFIIAFDNVVISDKSWNCLGESSCAVCDIEYENENIHQNQPLHILRVIQMQVEFDENKNIYRKIDEESFHCLTCNIVHSLNSLTSHFVEKEHKEQYQACCDAYKTINREAEETHEVKHNSTPKVDITTKPADIKQITKEPKQNKDNKTTKAKTLEANELESSMNALKEKENGPLKISKVIYDEDCEERICKALDCKDYITRDENSKTWCILCNWVLDPSNIRTHINGKHHQTILKLHKERLKNMTNKSIQINDEVVVVNDNCEILDNLSDFQNNDININFETHTAVCKKCQTDVDFDHKAIESHILEHKKNTVKKEEKSIHLDAGNSDLQDRKTKLFTSPVRISKDDEKGSKSKISSDNKKQNLPCERISKGNESVLSQSSKNDKDATKNAENKQLKGGEVQIINPKMKKVKTVTLNKVPVKYFIDNIITVDNLIYKDIVINNKYCLNVLSLNFTRVLSDNNLRCLSCEVNLHHNDIEIHGEEARHQAALNDVSVITNDDSEFIREVRPGTFHCGFCNTIESPWEDMEMHLKCTAHKECKNSAVWRLSTYRPRIERDNFERMVAQNVLMDALVSRFL